jgi:hypothetical protein
MDPDKLLAELREVVADFREAEDGKSLIRLGDELAAKFADLDDWLVNGGFKPHAWSRAY